MVPLHLQQPRATPGKAPRVTGAMRASQRHASPQRCCLRAAGGAGRPCMSPAGARPGLASPDQPAPGTQRARGQHLTSRDQHCTCSCVMRVGVKQGQHLTGRPSAGWCACGPGGRSGSCGRTPGARRPTQTARAPRVRQARRRARGRALRAARRVPAQAALAAPRRALSLPFLPSWYPCIASPSEGKKNLGKEVWTCMAWARCPDLYAGLPLSYPVKSHPIGVCPRASPREPRGCRLARGPLL